MLHRLFVPQVIGEENRCLEVYPFLSDRWCNEEVEFNSFDLMGRNGMRAERSSDTGLPSDNPLRGAFHQDLAFCVRRPDMGLNEAHWLVSDVGCMDPPVDTHNLAPLYSFQIPLIAIYLGDEPYRDGGPDGKS